ncbi:hypothetical protein ALC57_09540, partial [Trachymyrmex cornetzi]
RSTARTGLSDDVRTRLLAKFEVKDGLSTVGPPKLNRMPLPILKASSTISKRDKHIIRTYITYVRLVCHGSPQSQFRKQESVKTDSQKKTDMDSLRMPMTNTVHGLPKKKKL